MKTYKFVKDMNYLKGGEEIIPKENNVTHFITDEQIKKIYEEIDTNVSVSDPDMGELVKNTYGEILHESVEDLIKLIGVTKDDVFYDLGSGNGKVVLQFFINSPASKAYGIEYFPERSFISERALKKAYKLFPKLLDSDDRIISYQIKNIKNIHYLDNATIIFMCSTCYPSELLDIIYKKIEDLKDKSKLRYVITHKEYDNFKKILPNHQQKHLKCSWNSSSLMWNIYSK